MTVNEQLLLKHLIIQKSIMEGGVQMLHAQSDGLLDTHPLLDERIELIDKGYHTLLRSFKTVKVTDANVGQSLMVIAGNLEALRMAVTDGYRMLQACQQIDEL